MFSPLEKIGAAIRRLRRGRPPVKQEAAPEQRPEVTKHAGAAAGVTGDDRSRAVPEPAAAAGEPKAPEATLEALLSAIIKTLQPPPPEPAPRKRLQKVVDYFSAARTVVVSALTILVLALLCTAFVYESFKEDAVQIASFEVPEEFQKKGYTSYSLANALARHLDEINRGAAQPLEMRRHRFSTGSQESTLDIEVPQANVSLRSIIGYVKGFIRPATRVDGEIIVVGEKPDHTKDVALNLRVFNGKSGETYFVSKRDSDQKLLAMIEDGATDIYSFVEPVQLAMYVYNRPQNDPNKKSRAVELIRQGLQNETPEDDYWAYVMLGLIKVDDGDHQEAEYLARKAIGIRPEIAEAYHLLGYVYDVQTWGRAVTGSQEVEKALQAAVDNYEKALSLNPKFTATYNNLANIFLDKGEYDRAREYLNRSIAIRNTWDVTHTNLGRVLNAKGDYNGATSEFKTALLLNPDSTHALRSWGDVLKARGEYEGALDRYLSAVRLGDRDSVVLYEVCARELQGGGNFRRAAEAYIALGDVLKEKVKELINNGDAAGAERLFEEATAKYDEAKRLDASPETGERADAALAGLNKEMLQIRKPPAKPHERRRPSGRRGQPRAAPRPS